VWAVGVCVATPTRPQSGPEGADAAYSDCDDDYFCCPRPAPESG
jgi:hypothetical protein